MLAPPINANIYLYRQPVDFRKGIDALVGVCKNTINIDPFKGTYFLFYNRERNAIRVLVYDGQGFWLCTKRLSSGKFGYPFSSSSEGNILRPCEFLAVLWNGKPSRMSFSPDWKKVVG